MAAVAAWQVPCAPYGRRVGVAGFLGHLWPPGGRGRSFKPRMAVMGEWPVPWAPYGFRGGVAGPLFPVWQPWGRGRSPGPRMADVGAWRSPGARIAAVGAWPVRSCLYGRRGGGAGPLDPVWLPWGVAGPLVPEWPPWLRGLSTGPLMDDVGAWPVAWCPYGRRGGVVGPWVSHGRRGGVAGFLVPVWPLWGCGRTPGPRTAAVGS